MSNNIIFIIFILLFIILISFFHTTKEGFDDTSSTTTPAPTEVTSNTTTPSYTSTPSSTTTPGSSYTTMPESTTTPGSSYTTTPGSSYTNPPTSIQTTAPTSADRVDCQYTWSNWSGCSLSSGLTTRNYATQPPQNGGAACTTPPASRINIQCLRALSFSEGLVGWTYMYDPDSTDGKTKSVRQSTHVIQTYDYTKDTSSNLTSPDINGFNKFKNPNNYAYVGFDNTSGYFKDINLAGDGTATITLSTSIINLPPGHYLLTYYVQARSTKDDAKAIRVSAYTNGTSKIMDSTKNEPYNFRSTTEDLTGKWVIQYLPIAITSDKLESPNVNFKFTLFDTNTLSYSMVALGGISIQSCGSEPCSIDCTYVFSDWTNCDFNSGTSTRTMATIPPFNGAACTRPPASSLNKNCFDPLNFRNSDLTKDGWQILYNPVAIANTKSVNILTTDSEKDNVFQFNNADADSLFKGSYTIVNFNNTTGALSSYTNPTTALQTSMQLAPGNYRMTYFVQSWVSPDETDKQSISIIGTFGDTQNTFSFKSPSMGQLVAPGVWYPLAMDLTVTSATVQPVPVQFQFTLTSSNSGENNAVALGGIKLKSCGANACTVDCQYVWEDWAPCNDYNMTVRNVSIITNPTTGGQRCPAPIVKACSALPKDCQYVWDEWSPCEPGKTNRTRTQRTIPPQLGGQKCKSTLVKTETSSDCPIDCQYNGWSNYSSCVRGNLPENADRVRTANTIPPINGGAACTPGVQSDTTISDCPVDCNYSWSEWSKCDINSTRQTRAIITRQPMNGGTACTVPPVADTIQDICPVNCESSYTNKCDRSTAGVNKRTYTVTKIAANRKCNAADGEELKNQIGSETKNRDECAINCESTFTDHCDHSTGGIRKRHYNVTGIAYNRKCIASDGKQLTNSTGLQITDNERCPVDCKYSYTEVGCENGIKKYKVDRGFGPKMNGGRDCYYKGTLIDTPEQVFKATTLDESEMCITNCSAEKLSEKCDRSTGGKYLANYRVNSLAYNTNCNAPDGIRLPNAVGVHNNIDTGRTCPVNGTAEMQRVPGCATGKVQYKSTNYQAPLNGGGYPKYNNRDIVNNDMVFNSGETCNTCEGYWDNWSACKNIDNRCQRERNYTIPGPNAGSCPENIRNQKQYSTSGCVGSYLSKTECRWNPRGGPFGVGLHECNTHEDLNTCVG